MDSQGGVAADIGSFAKPILINMANRPGRLRDSLAELSAAAGRAVSVDADVHLVRPRRFDESGGFANRGFRSNLDAHLRAAVWARNQGLERVLILEDDLSFGPAWARSGAAMLLALTDRRWHIASLGYLDSYGQAPKPVEPTSAGWVEFAGQVDGAHAYFLHRSAYDDWIAHLEAVAGGRPGDDLRGPMPSDGAINTFVWVNSHVVRLLAVPNMVGTRPTRSDISPGLVDRLPVVGAAVEGLRRLRRQRAGTRAINF